MGLINCLKWFLLWLCCIIISVSDIGDFETFTEGCAIAATGQKRISAFRLCSFNNGSIYLFIYSIFFSFPF